MRKMFLPGWRILCCSSISSIVAYVRGLVKGLAKNTNRIFAGNRFAVSTNCFAAINSL